LITVTLTASDVTILRRRAGCMFVCYIIVLFLLDFSHCACYIAPLYLRTLWRYTNAAVIVIILS